MQLKRIGIMIVVLAAIVCAPAVHADEKAVRKEIEGNYTVLARAFKEKNLPKILSYLTPDYTSTGQNGAVSDRKKTEAEQKQTMAAAKSLEAQFVVKQLSVKGNTAVTTLLYKLTMVTKPELDANKTHKVAASVPMRHTWVKLAQGWRLKAAEEQAGGTLNLDGKPQKIDRAR